MKNYFSSLIEQSISRTTEATLGVLSITDAGLRKHLSEIMRRECGQEGSFLAPPLFEQTFGWEESDVSMAQLADEKGLLSREVVASLDNKDNERYRFGANWKPFTHQLASWESLLQKKRSVVVTSGTGSGKTECFMVPVLDDLYREYKHNGNQPLVGVRALFLYPLNALINSQRERLSAWTRNFGSGIRYCLYNGNTEELKAKKRAEQKSLPNEILSRELMREEPAPILVTNGTMLEYMMVRQIDAPIIQISRQQKSLRWIILDEAHTYIGSQAAELALQLRRVMIAFGVTPNEVRFVATSATIAGEEAAEQLKQFLSDLSGVPVEQIDVLGGRRVVPSLETCQGRHISLEALEQIPTVNSENPDVNAERFDALVHSPLARDLRQLLVGSPIPLKLTELVNHLNQSGKYSLTQGDVLRWLDLCSGSQPNETAPAFLKLRAHLFQRTTQGLWSCCDKNCSEKQGTPLEHDWPFGYVYVNQRQTCRCGGPVFELAWCNECNEPHLLAREKKKKLVQWDGATEDEFSLEIDRSKEEYIDGRLSEDTKLSMIPLVISSDTSDSNEYHFHAFDKLTREIGVSTVNSIRLRINDQKAICSRKKCGHSGYQDALPFRRALLGSPFYVANVVPTVLEYCQDFQPADKSSHGPQSLPGRGRRLITFTDSRQGTARMSVRMQQEAERSRLRGLVVESISWLQQKQAEDRQIPNNLNPECIEQMIKNAKNELSTYLSLGLRLEVKATEEKIQRLTEMLAAATGKTVRSKLIAVPWNELVKDLMQRNDLKGSMLLANKYQKPEVFAENDGPYKLTEMLLFREFMRRPKRQNSLETQGLVKVSYQGLDKDLKLPESWEKKGLTQKDWVDFLKVALDFYVRENSFIQINESWKSWIGSRFSSKTLRAPESKDSDEMRVKRWPQIRNGNYSQRLIKLLLLGTGLSPFKPADVDLINEWLKMAWQELTKTEKRATLKPDGNQFFLPREHILFSLVDQAYVCPVTHKVLDTTFKGFTPYLPTYMDFSTLTEKERKLYVCEQIEMPDVWKFDRSQEDEVAGLIKIREQVAQDAKISDLRARNLWTDINDRAVEGGFYYRTVEHSAQQSSDRLGEYERMFKNGQVNVMNCSTTMEMGVDIGGISAVVMNNVPPHPANYLQRAGRAGRSKESRALAYTLCKNNPHDQQVFANPSWPFNTIIPAPAVALSSRRLVQRHVNALLLSDFLCNVIGPTQKEKTNLNTEWFYSDSQGGAPCDRFIELLSSATAKIDETVAHLVKGTELAGIEPHKLRREAMIQLQKLQSRWLGTYRYLQAEEKKSKGRSSYLKRLQIEKARHCQEYLLRDLSARTWLPGYGFPTDVVSFDNFTIEDYIRENKDHRRDREDNVSRYKGLPSRNLAIAIREYAPGAEIVLDGRVFKSAGVSLHWQNLNLDTNEAQKIDTAWRCSACGQSGYEEGLVNNADLRCTNSECAESINPSNILRVLQPAGFVTDAYASTSNDIQHQKFIPIETSWVFVKGDKTPLPNPAIGSMTYGTDGLVFHHSSGENGEGFALCMSCGRAESMKARDEFPAELSPLSTHYPPRPSKEDKDGQNRRIPCQNSGNIMANIRLGARAFTDVFELMLRNPISGEYLADTSEGRRIALTLAVALRSALAEILGISASELGYATRPSKLDNGQAISVIQLYDVISGGAGFATSAPLYIENVLRAMVEHLRCSHCETGCSVCLVDSQTRHDFDNLNRQGALDWLGSDFLQYVGLSEETKLAMSDGQYEPGSIEMVLRRLINSGASRLTLIATGEVANWDMQTPQFRRALKNYVLTDGVAVDLIIPAGITDKEILQEISNLASLGVNIGSQTVVHNPHYAAQVMIGSQLYTLASSSTVTMIPGADWHQSNGLVVMSKIQPAIEWTKINIAKAPSSGAKDLQIHDELNGSLLAFGERFWGLVGTHNTNIANILSEGKINKLTYSDRYIQNPAAITILGSLLLPLKDRMAKGATYQVRTLFKSGKNQGAKAYDDWTNEEDFQFFAEKWLSDMTGQKVEFIIERSNRDIPHHRRLDLEFEGGKKLKVRFDQGMAYWRVYFGSHSDMWFDFERPVEDQIMHMAKVGNTAQVQNSEKKWSTDVLVEIQ